MENIREKIYHDRIIENPSIQIDILNLLESDTTKDYEFIHEDQYINGITADFTVVNDNKIKAIIEVKANDIGVTDYVRGIGQILQYEYFYEKSITQHSYEFSDQYLSVLLVPSSVIHNKNFNIGKFKYPHRTKIVEINDYNNVVRGITETELSTLGSVDENNLTSISQYYVRDTRIFELYMGLRYLCIKKLKGVSNVKRPQAEAILRQTNTINNGNWRNVWISLSSLGLISSNNLPTEIGSTLGSYEYPKFLQVMYKSYLKPYIDEILNIFTNNKKLLSKKNSEICNEIFNKFNRRNVLFLTQSDGRYLSSWLNIMRDDFGCLSFESRKNNRQIIYTPSELSDDAIIRKIGENEIYKEYINRFLNVI